MQNLQRAQNNKEKILSTLRMRGPSLPVQVAKAISMDPLFASAFLSELKAEGKIKISNLKVGSSPLYYLPEHDSQLENYTHYLNTREKEAHTLLKTAHVLADDKQTPVVRVALREIKDFAIPLRARINGEVKLFWKHYLIPDNTVGKFIQTTTPKKNHKEKIQEQTLPKKPETKTSEQIHEKPEPTVQQKENPETKISKQRQEKPTPDNPFATHVKKHLTTKKITLTETLSEKKREITSKILIPTLLGTQGYYLCAKDKKTLTENDLALTLQQSQTHKMPALILSPGHPNNKAQNYLKIWEHLIRYEHLPPPS